MARTWVVDLREVLYPGSAAVLAMGLRVKAGVATADLPNERHGVGGGLQQYNLAGSPDSFHHVDEATERGLNNLDTTPAYGCAA